MKSPKEIYLQIDGEHHDYGGATWCQDKIYDTDVKYIRADLVVAQLENSHDFQLKGENNE